MAERGLRFIGVISIEVDQTQLQAAINLTKGGDLEWDDAALNKALLDAGVKEGFDRDDLHKIIVNFQRNKDLQTHREVFARGTLPTPPRGEDYEWSPLTLPEDLNDVWTKVQRTHRSPEIYEVRQEKVLVEKTPEPGKGHGLFGGGKEAPQKVQETREVREKVLVDPKVEALGFVEANALVAQVYAPVQGKPGRDLAGKQVPPPQPKKTNFYLSDQLQRTKEGVRTLTSGFLRRGKNWAELIPYQNHRFEVTFSEDRTSAFLSVFPGNPESPRFTVQAIYDFLDQEKFSRDGLVAEADITRKLETAFARREAFTAWPLTPSQDGEARIQVTPDNLKAYLYLRKAVGQGKPFSLKDLGAQIREKNFKGLDMEFLKARINEFMTSPATELQDFLLVQGKSPTRGGEKTLEFLVDFMTQEEIQEIAARAAENPKLKSIIPHLDEMPLEAVTQATPVTQGQKFATIKPSEIRGEDGIDVFGQKVGAYPGNDPVFTVLSGVRRTGDVLEATADGLLEIAQTSQGLLLRVRFHKDALVEVRRSEDNMKAYLTLEPAKGTGRTLSEALIRQALEEEQVYEGIDEKALKDALEQAVRGQRVEMVLVARGIPPGGDLASRLNFLIPMKKNISGTLQTGPALANTPLAEYLPPDGASGDGKDVSGNLIPGGDSEVSHLKLGDFLRTQPKEGSDLQLILADKAGELVFDGRALTLKDQLVLGSGVNARTGNIKFSGAVQVEGVVDRGFFIMAGGDLKIQGQVQGALLSSEGSIQVSEGVRGEGKAVLRAKKQIVVGFVEKSVVLPVGDFYALRSILNCQVKCNGRVIQKSDAGSIIGGHIKSKFGVDAINLGHPSGTPTMISFGQDYLIENQIEAEEKETEKLRQAILKIDEVMKSLTRPEDGPKLAGVRQQKVLMLKLLEKRNLKLINLRDKFEAHFPSEIIVRGTLFPGVAIESHGRFQEIKEKKSKLKLVFDLNTGHIVEKPLEG